MKMKLNKYGLLTDELIEVSLRLSGNQDERKDYLEVESYTIKEILQQAIGILKMRKSNAKEKKSKRKANPEEEKSDNEKNEIAGGNDKKTWDMLVKSISPTSEDGQGITIIKTPQELFNIVIKKIGDDVNFLREIQDKRFTPPSFAIGDKYEKDKTNSPRKDIKIDGLYLILSYAAFYITRVSEYYVENTYYINIYSLDNFIIQNITKEMRNEGILSNAFGKIGFSSEVAAIFHLYRKFHELIPVATGQELFFGFIVFFKNERGLFQVKNVPDYKLSLSNKFFIRNLGNLVSSDNARTFEYLINTAMRPTTRDLKNSTWSTVNSFLLDLFNFLNSEGKMNYFKIKYNRIIYTELHYPYLIGKTPDKKDPRYFVLASIQKIMKIMEVS